MQGWKRVKRKTTDLLVFLFWQFDWYISFLLRYFLFLSHWRRILDLPLFIIFSSFSKISSAENTFRARKNCFSFSNKIFILSDNWFFGVLLESVEMTEEKEIANNEENIVKKTVIGSSEAVTASQDYNCKYITRISLCRTYFVVVF